MASKRKEKNLKDKERRFERALEQRKVKQTGDKQAVDKEKQSER